MGGRIDVEANDIPELVGELRVVRQLEGSDAVRGKLVGFENALDGAQADAGGLGQHPPGPVGCLARWRAERQIDDALHRLWRQRRLAGRPRLVPQQPVDALLHEALLPAPDDGFGLAGPAHHIEGSAAVGRGQDDPGPPDMLLGRTAIRHDRLKPTAIFRRDVDDDPCSHPESLNCFGRFGNCPKESNH